jgi:SAM-dependent methyltransferase/ribosomal protein S18 acetylase RimI-like enzyme
MAEGTTVVAPVTGRVRAVARNDANGIAEVARLHMALLGFGPLAGLGEFFIREIGYRVNLADGLLQLALYEVDGRAAGFVAYTQRSITFHRSALRRHWVRVLIVLALTMLRHPYRLPQLMRVLKVMRSRRGETRIGGDPMGEVVAIAVQREYLAPDFIRRSGLRVTDELIRHAMAYLRRAGVGEMRMLVDAPNKAALLMYHRLGARFEPYEQAGEPMVHVWFDIAPLDVAAGREVPACWSPARAVVDQHKPVSEWTDYWERLEDRQAIFRAEAQDFVARLQTAVTVSNRTRALDFGCGFGFVANAVAPHVGTLALWDAAANMRARARLNVAAHNNVQFVDLSRTDHGLDGAFDLITVNSVVQYMTREELQGWLRQWRAMLAPGGHLVISDIVLPSYRFASDIVALSRFALRHGFLIEALREGVREYRSYGAIKKLRPLLQLDHAAIGTLAAATGLRVEFLPDNLTFRTGRATAVFTAAPSGLRDA